MPRLTGRCKRILGRRDFARTSQPTSQPLPVGSNRPTRLLCLEFNLLVPPSPHPIPRSQLRTPRASLCVVICVSSLSSPTIYLGKILLPRWSLRETSRLLRMRCRRRWRRTRRRSEEEGGEGWGGSLPVHNAHHPILFFFAFLHAWGWEAVMACREVDPEVVHLFMCVSVGSSFFFPSVDVDWKVHRQCSVLR